MKQTYYEKLDERVFETRLPNGLAVFVLPKKGFSQKCAYFVTNYGSIDTKFTQDGKKIETPAGVAHYLEHKMFDLPGRDVMAEFSALGANPNAFTSYHRTAYCFSCTEHFEACLELLLTYVSTPYFTQEIVEKERGIINQEILMYEDSADSKGYEDLFAMMLQNHPAKTPIAGSVESVAEITAQTLYDCFTAFYQPTNMALCVVGDVDPAAVAETALRLLPQTSAPVALRDYGEPEQLTSGVREFTREMDVSMPTFLLGFKCPVPENGEALARMRIVGDLAAEALLGESSALYLRLYDEALIDGSFGGGFEDLPGAAMFTCGGDSPKPFAVRDAILAEARRLANEGIEKETFEALKKSAMGRRIRSLDNFDGVCFRLCESYFEGISYLDFPEIYASVTRQEAEAFLRENLTFERSSTAVIYPRNWEA